MSTKRTIASTKRPASSPLSDPRPNSRRRLVSAVPTSNSRPLPMNEQRVLDNLRRKSFGLLNPTLALQSLAIYASICDKLERGSTDPITMSRLHLQRAELELLLDTQKEINEVDIQLIRNSASLRKKLRGELWDKVETRHAGKVSWTPMGSPSSSETSVTNKALHPPEVLHPARRAGRLPSSGPSLRTPRPDAIALLQKSQQKKPTLKSESNATVSEPGDLKSELRRKDSMEQS